MSDELLIEKRRDEAYEERLSLVDDLSSEDEILPYEEYRVKAGYFSYIDSFSQSL